jgi:hypothetical protein
MGLRLLCSYRRCSILQIGSSPCIEFLITLLSIFICKTRDDKMTRQSEHFPSTPTLSVAISRVDVAPQYLITPSPAPVPLLGRQDSSKKYEYPACRDDTDGPCSLQDSSSEACERQFATMSGLIFNKQYYCMCTNGYYERSSE